MPLEKLDTEQKKAATSIGLEVAVSAGAGSGKTRLLVGRYLYLLMSGNLSMNEIAAITFTEKAASQMKSAVAKRAAEMAVSDSEHAALWRSVSSSVYAAPISTIHAFCNSILRNNPEEADFDPAYSILDDASAAVLLRETIDVHVRESLDTEPELMETLLGAFGLKRLKQIYRTALNNRVKLVSWLDSYGSVDSSDIDRNCVAYLGEMISKSAQSLQQFHVFAPGDDSFGDKVRESVPVLKHLAGRFVYSTVTPDHVSKTIDFLKKDSKKGSPKKWRDNGGNLSLVRVHVKDIIELLESALTYLLHEAGQTSRIGEMLTGEFILLEQRYLSAKKKRSVFDHDDTLIETWRLLRKSAVVSGRLSRTYRYFLIDEFQDTDSLQMDILKMIAGNSAASLFTVGDPKQSIYRFRGADVAVFNNFVAGRDVEFKTLRTNYRSAAGVINFINTVFSDIMGRGAGIAYEAEYSEMRAYRGESFADIPVEIVVVDGDSTEKGRRVEAEIIARKIRELHDNFSIDYGDMALLFRKGTIIRAYEEILLREGIPYVNMTSGRLSDFPEIHDITNLLRWLCEPSDPILFSAVLLSPFFMVDKETLSGLSLLSGDAQKMPESFLQDNAVAGHEYFRDTGLEHVRDLMLDLLAKRDRMDIADILEYVFDKTGYTMQILADPVNGDLTLSVIDSILAASREFENNGGDIYQFAEQLADGSIFSEFQASLESDERAVNLLTIHKSKGLEYRVVFVADAGGKGRSGVPEIGFHDRLGPGFSLREPGGSYRPSLAHAMLAVEEKNKANAESKRLFYVACTRAEDYLMILGGEPSKKADLFYEKDSWMTWLHTALGIDPSGENAGDGHGLLYRYRRIDDAEPEKPLSVAEFWSPMLNAAPSDKGRVSGDQQELLSKISALPVIVRNDPPRHLSPSQLLDYIDCPALYYYRHVWSLDISGSTSSGYGPRYGVLAHSALEIFDFDMVLKPEEQRKDSITALVVDCVSAGDPERWALKLTDELNAFADSDLAKKMAVAEDLRREEPFCFLSGDVLVRGTMDALYFQGNDCGIVDFKTDSITGDEVEAHSERYRLQLGIYALAYEKAAFRLPKTLALYYLAPGVVHEISCDREFLDYVTGQLESVIQSLTEGDFVSKKNSRCEFCPYTAMCGTKTE